MKLIYTSLFILLVIAVTATGCSQQPVEIHYGSDECAHCKMMITDERFAAQLVTEKGKAIKFDAVECLVSYHRDHEEELENSVLWVNDFEQPGEWLNALEAHYVQSEDIQSPMGASLFALPGNQQAKEHTRQGPGHVMSWNELSGAESINH